MGWKNERWLKTSELLLSIFVFVLHCLSSPWWSPFGHNFASLIKSTGVCGPLIPQFFRNGPYFYGTTPLPKQVNLFIVVYCFASYCVGCLLLTTDSVNSKNRIISRNVDLFSAFLSAVLITLFIFDVVYIVIGTTYPVELPF